MRSPPPTFDELLDNRWLWFAVLVLGFVAAVAPPYLVVWVGFLPGFFWLRYFHRHDLEAPEPHHLVVVTFIAGMAAAIPAGILNPLCQTALGLSDKATAVLVAPVVEEALKCIAVVVVISWHREFDEPFDGILYAAAVALGFAALENALYLLSVEGEARIQMFMLRSVLSVPGHAVHSAFWGAALGVLYCCGPAKAFPLILLGLAAGMLSHAIFNLTATAVGHILVLFIIFALLWQFVQGLFQWSRAHPRTAHREVDGAPAD